MTIHAMLVTLMVTAAPLHLADLPAYPGWKETQDERRERYEEIANAAELVAYDPTEVPVFASRSETAVTLLAVAFHESAFARDVDLGPCYRGRDGKGVRCDSGKAACLMQIEVGIGMTPEGWTREDLFGDRVKCFRAGMRHLRRTKCGKGIVDDTFFNGYAGGRCDRSSWQSRTLFDTFKTWSRRAA